MSGRISVLPNVYEDLPRRTGRTGLVEDEDIKAAGPSSCEGVPSGLPGETGRGAGQTGGLCTHTW